MAASRPNILCIVTDQHRADHLGCYGNPDVQTPNIDRLAREGVRFTESFVTNPVCMPNRATMFTGRVPKAHGLRENGNTLSPDATVLPEVLRQAGYATASIGKIHLAPFGMAHEHADHEYEMYESWRYWDEGGDLPLPYYALEHVYLVSGHGPGAYGHFRRELDAEAPGLREAWQKQNALESPTGAREAWKCAIPAERHFNTVIADKTIEYLENHDGEKPLKMSRFDPGKMDPASSPTPMFRLPCRPERNRPRSSGPKKSPTLYRSIL